MESLNLYNHSNKLNQELINKNAYMNIYNKKCHEVLPNNVNFDVYTFNKEKEKFNDNGMIDISFENSKMKNYFETVDENKTNKNYAFPKEIEQNKNMFYQSTLSNNNNDNDHCLNKNFYFNGGSYLAMNDNGNQKNENNSLERNNKFLINEYASELKFQNNFLAKYHNHLSENCKNNMHTGSQQTIMCESQQSLLDMYQNNVHINSQQTLKFDSEQNLSDYFQNNICSNPKPEPVLNSDNREYDHQRFPYNNNSKQMEFSYPNNNFNAYEQDLKNSGEPNFDYVNDKNTNNESAKSVIYEDEKNTNNKPEKDKNNESAKSVIYEDEKNTNNKPEKDTNNESAKSVIYEDEKNTNNKPEQDTNNEFEQNVLNGDKQNIKDESDHYINNHNAYIASDLYKQNTSHIYENTSSGACENNLKDHCTNDIYNMYEQNLSRQFHENTFNAYEQHLTRMNINGNNNGNLTDRPNAGQIHFNNQLDLAGYNNYANSHQNNSFLPKFIPQNSASKPDISNNTMGHNLKEEKNESINGFMTIKTLNMNTNHSITNEIQPKQIENVHTHKSVFLKTNMHNNIHNFKNNNTMNNNDSWQMNAMFSGNRFPHQINASTSANANTNVNGLKNSAPIGHNITNQNCNIEKTQQYPSGKQHLSNYLNNQYKMNEITNYMPEPTLYSKQNFDVPNIIQGLTTKHNNGIVTECNQDTIIEYDNKWRLVSGKRFPLNQNDSNKPMTDSAEAFQIYLDQQNMNTKKMIMNSKFNSLTGNLVVNPAYDEDLNDMKKVHNYKDILRSYPSYYNINRGNDKNRIVTAKESLKGMVDNNPAADAYENEYYNKNMKLAKKKTMVKKQNLPLCGDYLLKHKVKEFISTKMKDYFNVNLFNHYI